MEQNKGSGPRRNEGIETNKYCTYRWDGHAYQCSESDLGTRVETAAPADPCYRASRPPDNEEPLSPLFSLFSLFA